MHTCVLIFHDWRPRRSMRACVQLTHSQGARARGVPSATRKASTPTSICERGHGASIRLFRLLVVLLRRFPAFRDVC